MNAVLLYSEVPKGMKSYGPKAIIPLGKLKTPLIVKQIRSLKNICKKIYILIGFDKTKIIDIINKYNFTDIHIEFIDYDHFDKTNELGSISYLFTKLNLAEDYLIIQGGVVPGGIGASVKDALFFLDNKQLVSDMNGFNLYLNKDNNDTVSNLFYDITKQTWTEMAILTGNTIQKIQTLIQKNKIYNSMFFFECLNALLSTGTVFETIKLSKNTIKINNHKQLK